MVTHVQHLTLAPVVPVQVGLLQTVMTVTDVRMIPATLLPVVLILQTPPLVMTAPHVRRAILVPVDPASVVLPQTVMTQTDVRMTAVTLHLVA